MIHLGEGKIALQGKKLIVKGLVSHKPQGEVVPEASLFIATPDPVVPKPPSGITTPEPKEEWKPYEGEFDILNLADFYSALGLFLLGKVEGNTEKPVWKLYQGKSMIGLYKPQSEEVRKRFLLGMSP